MHVITSSSSFGLTSVLTVCVRVINLCSGDRLPKGLGYHYISVDFVPPAAAPPPPPNRGNEPMSRLKNLPKPRKLSFKLVAVVAGGVSPCIGVADLDGIVLTVCPAEAARPGKEVAFGTFSRSTPSFAALRIAEPNDEAPER